MHSVNGALGKLIIEGRYFNICRDNIGKSSGLENRSKDRIHRPKLRRKYDLIDTW